MEYLIKNLEMRMLQVNEMPFCTNDMVSQRIARRVIGDCVEERVIIMGLSGSNGLIGVVQVSQGGLDGAAILPRDVFRPAIAMGASAIILAHNHPSGSSHPSPEDVKMTEELSDIGKSLGCPVLDHLIVTRNDNYFSFLNDKSWALGV